MMKNEVSLPSGREFEQYVFGVAGGSEVVPPYVEFDLAMRQAIESPVARFGPGGYLDDEYDPIKPNWGQMHAIWSEVKKHLPRRSREGRNGPLALYIAIDTPLDYYHGVDSFFRWMGVYSTLDASLILKSKSGAGRKHLKADFLITPKNLTKSGLADLGKRIADHLKEMRRLARKKAQGKSGSRGKRENYYDPG